MFHIYLIWAIGVPDFIYSFIFCILAWLCTGSALLSGGPHRLLSSMLLMRRVPPGSRDSNRGPILRQADTVTNELRHTLFNIYTVGGYVWFSYRAHNYFHCGTFNLKSAVLLSYISLYHFYTVMFSRWDLLLFYICRQTRHTAVHKIYNYTIYMSPFTILSRLCSLSAIFIQMQSVLNTNVSVSLACSCCSIVSA